MSSRDLQYTRYIQYLLNIARNTCWINIASIKHLNWNLSFYFQFLVWLAWHNYPRYHGFWTYICLFYFFGRSNYSSPSQGIHPASAHWFWVFIGSTHVRIWYYVGLCKIFISVYSIQHDNTAFITFNNTVLKQQKVCFFEKIRNKEGILRTAWSPMIYNDQTLESYKPFFIEYFLKNRLFLLLNDFILSFVHPKK